VPDILDLVRVLVQPNGQVLFIRPDRILDVSQLLFRQGLAEPGGGHQRVKGQGLPVAVDGFFQAPQRAQTACFVVPGSGALGVEAQGPVQAGDGAFPMPQAGKDPRFVVPAGCILRCGSDGEGLQVGHG
jgi:hypothetical protein